MQFQVSTDYAIRILQYLHGHSEDLPTAMTIAQTVGITYPFFIKVANRLKQKGLLDAVQGRNGGYRLARDASEISLYDVLLAMEGDLRINRCLQDDHYCSRDAVGSCPVHGYFSTLQDSLIQELSHKYIADFS